VSGDGRLGDEPKVRAAVTGDAAGIAKAAGRTRPDTGTPGKLMAAVARIERRLADHEQVAHRVIDLLAIHDEKLNAILEAATREPGPSPLLGLLEGILESLREQESLLAALPGALAETIRDEWPREPEADDPEIEPIVDQFDDRPHERH